MLRALSKASLSLNGQYEVRGGCRGGSKFEKDWQIGIGGIARGRGSKIQKGRGKVEWRGSWGGIFGGRGWGTGGALEVLTEGEGGPMGRVRREGMGSEGWARRGGCLGEERGEGRTCPSCTLGTEEAEGWMGWRPIGGEALPPLFKAVI